MTLPPLDLRTSEIVALLLFGAFLGAILFELTVGRYRTRGLAKLARQLASDDVTGVPGSVRLYDRRLTRTFEHLASRLAGVQAMATVDQLTGLLNRQAILTVLEGEIERATRYGRPLSVVFVDIDHFKRVNDTFGHLAGDRLLHHVAKLLHANVRSIDHVGRYGGEEFILIMPETDVDAAATSAEKLRRIVGSSDLSLEDGNVLKVNISAGVAGGLGGGLKLDPLIRSADAALYAAKGLGRDQVYVFRVVDDDGVVRRAPISPDARRQAVEVGRAALDAANRHLTEALEERASWAGAPSTLIAEVAVALARALGLPDGEVERIRTASLLHDLGKLAIPDAILSKPQGLNQAEWGAITEHPKIGHVILEQAGALRDAATVVLHHHEWFNGHGYPHGLSGSEIPIGSRIVAIADAYDAMVRGRPYKDAVVHRDALRELQDHAGTQFDPELVAILGSLFEDGRAAERLLADAARLVAAPAHAHLPAGTYRSAVPEGATVAVAGSPGSATPGAADEPASRPATTQARPAGDQRRRGAPHDVRPEAAEPASPPAGDGDGSVPGSHANGGRPRRPRTGTHG
jgi:diguanylate cyclase (GGDEF)-like protein